VQTITLKTPARGLAAGSTIAEKYQMMEKLGEGGMGLVYKAQDLKLKRIVALKFLPQELTRDKDARERFVQEAQAASALDHPNICTIYEINETESDQVFISMACYEGENLKAKIANRPLAPDNAIQIATQIAQGLSEAHKKGIIHRDIKPANIMFSNDGIVKIVDFGIAKLSGPSRLTRTGATIGTVAYMSPEQAQGDKVDHRTDIWSLGVVLYEMLTAQLPFKGEHEQAVIYSILNKNPEPVSKHCEQCPASLMHIINRALEKNPTARFSTADEFIDALHPSSDSEILTEKSIDISKILAEKEKHNLPTQLTSFIGREQDIREVKTLLTEHRLVTLIGTGGGGKTRLALQIAKDLVESFKDGVWFINLAPVNEPKLVFETTADILQIIEEHGQPLLKTIGSRLKDKKLLLMLDNCEHLIQACSELVEHILRSCPDIKILTTSREQLYIPGEIAWRVPSLSFPDLEQLPEFDQLLSQYEAVRLFVERASTNLPGFKLSKQNISAVAQICIHLDGIPLAIELAAARIKLLGPQTILDRLDNRFLLLKRSEQAGLPRQKTLRAALDWSYDLLSDEEKILFGRISVFSGGFDLEAVEEICSAEPMTREHILDLFSSLINKSLVVTNPQNDGSVRYRLLEILRQYAQVKLFESGEEQSIHENHFRYYLELAEQAYTGRFEATSTWLDLLEIEHDNLRAALEWSRSRPKDQVSLSGALYWFWQAHSHYATGIEYLNNALLAHKKLSPEVARALAGAAMLNFWHGGPMDDSLPWLEESQKMWQELDNQMEAGLLYMEKGQILCFREDYKKAMDCLTKSVEIFQELGDERLTVRSKTFLSFGYICQFKPEKAEPIVKPTLEQARKFNMTKEIMDCSHFFADCAMLKGDLEKGERRYGKALLAALDLGDIWEAAVEMQGMAMCIAGQSRALKAFRLNGAALAKFDEFVISIPYIRFWHESLAKYLGQARKKLGEKAAAKAEAEGKKMGFENAVKYALDFDKD
jgi:non-specific serine/threonine protein kinase